MEGFSAMMTQFKTDTGLEAKVQLPVFLEYLKTNQLLQITKVLAEINNRLVEIKGVQERRSQNR